MTRAALYARKSTPEEDKHEEAKSVTRQKADARAYAERKGWTVADAHVYEDDAISGKYGAERRPGLEALLTAAESTPRPFDVVVMAKDDRLMRDQWEVAAVLKRIHKAGARLFYYQEDREVSLKDAAGKFMEQVKGFAAEAYIESQTRHMVDTLKRKAKAGHVHGGRVFGYDNVRVDGHVERRVNDAEAAVVRDIFARYGRGETPKRVAVALTARGAPTPGLAGGWTKGTAWTKASVREVLLRETYRGVLVSRWGTETIRVERPDLRIVSEALWTAAQQRLAEQRAVYLRRTDGKLWGRPSNSVESQYLLTGLLTCGICGSGLTVVSRHHGRKRAHFYQCLGNVRGRRRGPHCANALPAPMAMTDQVVLTLIENTVLRPEVVTATITECLRRLRPDRTAPRRAALAQDLQTVERELANLIRAIKAGGDSEALAAEVKSCEARRQTLRDQVAALAHADQLAAVDLAALDADLRVRLEDWRGLLTRHVGSGRQILRKLIPERLVFTPHTEGTARYYTFEGVGRLEPVLQGTVMPDGSAPQSATSSTVRQGWWPQRDSTGRRVSTWRLISKGLAWPPESYFEPSPTVL